MPFGIINYKKFYPFVKPTEEENALKEAYIVELYNFKNPNNKIMLDNKENKYLHHDAIDKYETKYEIKSVNHIYNQFSGEFFPILKLYQHEYKNVRNYINFFRIISYTAILSNCFFLFKCLTVSPISNCISTTRIFCFGLALPSQISIGLFLIVP